MKDFTLVNTPQIKDFIEKLLNNSNFYFAVVIFSMLVCPVLELCSELIYKIPYIFERAYLSYLGMFGIVVFVRNLYVSKKFTLIDWTCILMYFFATLSVWYSTPTADTSVFYPYGNIEELFHYYAYFFLIYCVTKIDFLKHVKYILLAFIAIGLLHNFFGVFQLFGFRLAESYNYKEMHESLKCIYGLTSNFNFYASIATLFTAVSCATYMLTDVKFTNRKWIFLIFISSFCAICSSTRLAILGVFSVVLLVIALYLFVFLVRHLRFAKNDKYLYSFQDLLDKGAFKKLLVLIAIVAVSFICVLLFFPHLVEQTISEFITDFKSINSYAYGESKNSLEQVGSFRGLVWRFAFDYLANINWWTGTGIGNFREVFFQSPRLEEALQIVMFAHNEYFHIMVTQGVFAFILYILFYFYCIAKGVIVTFKSQNLEFKKYKAIVFIMLFAYMIQANFNCNVYQTFLYFWILLGMVLIGESTEKITSVNEDGKV